MEGWRGRNLQEKLLGAWRSLKGSRENGEGKGEEGRPEGMERKK